jgi:RND family efflux transporter MFP subunit
LTGEIKSTALVEVKPKLSGRLERLSLENGTPVAEGTLVKKDEIIAVLEHKDLKAQVDQATAALKTAQAAVETAKASIASAQAGVDAAEIIVANEKRDKERVDNLFNKGVLTENERDQATTEYDRAVADKVRFEAELTANRARRIQAEALVNQARAALQLSEITLQEAFLKSPLTGVVCAKYVDPGAMVGPTTAVVCIQPMNELKFVVSVPGEKLPKIDPSKTVVTISVATYHGHQFQSRISKVYPIIDPATRTATVEIIVKNEQNEKGEYLLLPGMYATARLVVERKENAVVVPADALVRRLDKYIAFVVQDGVARSRIVKVGMRSGEFLEILDGLSAGEELVAGGQHRLTNGTPVERVQSGSAGGEME